MKAVSLVYATLAILLFNACGQVSVKGKGNIITEKKELSAFSKINIDAPIKAIIKITPGAPSMSITGYENLMKQLTIKQVNNNLEIISNDQEDWNTDKEMVATIYTPSFNDIELHKTANAAIQGNLTNSNLTCTLSGSTQLSIEQLQTENLAVAISGVGTVKVDNGKAQDADFQISGAGNIDAYGLQTENTNAVISGTGNMNITVLQTLNATISGAGNISYKGSPSIQKQISGIGNLTKTP